MRSGAMKDVLTLKKRKEIISPYNEKTYEYEVKQKFYAEVEFRGGQRNIENSEIFHPEQRRVFCRQEIPVRNEDIIVFKVFENEEEWMVISVDEDAKFQRLIINLEKINQ